MAVYPFYVESDISSRKTLLQGGVKSKDGNMRTKIYQRENGAITTPFEVRQFTETRKDFSGEKDVLVCITQVYYQGELLKEHITEY